MSSIKNKLKSYFKIIILWFFVNWLPYFMSDFRIRSYWVDGILKILLILISWIFVSWTVYMFADDLKNVIDEYDWKRERLVVLSIIFSIAYLFLLAHNLL